MELSKQKPDASAASCTLDEQGHCITCSDEALPVRVISVDQQTGLALVEGDGEVQQLEEVDVTLIAEVSVGDWLLVHGGVALERLTETALSEGSHA